MIAVFALFAFSACGQKETGPQDGEETIRIAVTIFPEYDWVKNILGDDPAGAEVTMLMDSGVDLHSFQPSAKDMV